MSRVAAAALGLLLLVLVEGILQVLPIGPADELFIAEGQTYRLNPHAARRFFPHQYARLAPGQDRFARDKTDDTFRVFALGASTLLGFPNPAQTSFPNFLQAMLQDAYPDRRIEIVNCGVTAINSFVLLDFIEEVVVHRPDLVLVYAGHNEFIGPYGAATPFVQVGTSRSFIRLQMLLQRSRIYYLLGEALYRVGRWFKGDADAPSFGVHLVQREIYLGDAAHRRTEVHYRENLLQILDAVRARGVPLALCTLVSNLDGFYPLRSQNSAGDPRHAATQFERGLRLREVGDVSGAQAAFARARDLDAIHLRACTPFNDIVREVAAAPGAWLIDVEAAFAAAAPGGLVGDECSSEYLHPTVRGHQLLARTAFAEILQRERELGLVGGSGGRLRSYAAYCRLLGYGLRDEVLARNDLILLLRNMPYQQRPLTLLHRLAHLTDAQLRALPQLSYAQIADFARRGGFAFLASIIAELDDPALAQALEEVAAPLGFMPQPTSSSSP